MMERSDRENVNKRILSHSSLSWFRKSPAYFKYKVEHPEIKEETDALIFGNLVHTLVLEPDQVDNRYVIFDIEKRPEPDKTMASKANKEWKAKSLEDAGEKKLIKKEDFFKAEEMRKAVMKKAGDLFNAKGVNEQELAWRKDGVNFKGFIDKDTPLFMVDLKTAIDANPHKWKYKAFYDFRSHRQAAMYLDGDADGMYTGEKEFYFVVVEKEPPYLVSIILVGKEKIAEGMQEYKELLAGIKKCRETGNWPDFFEDAHTWE